MKPTSPVLGSIAALLTSNFASAQPYSNDNRRGDTNNGYGRTERDSDYGHEDQNRFGSQQNERAESTQYRKGAYEQKLPQRHPGCDTIFDALDDDLIGSAASQVEGAAVVGGAVLAGLFGNTISYDISCDRQPYATCSTGLNGQIGRRDDWNRGQERGNFVPTGEYRRADTNCRDFRKATYRDSRQYTRSDTSCRTRDDNWQSIDRNTRLGRWPGPRVTLPSPRLESRS